jgi:ATP synthase protein I
MTAPFRDPTTTQALRTLGSLGAVGLAFVLAIVLGFWFGRTLDSWLGTSPLFMIVFFFLGLAAGILNVYRTVRSATRDLDRSR